MGYLKDLSSEVISPPFPQATFEIAGDVPQAQCSEAKIEATDAQTFSHPTSYLLDINKFLGWALTDKFCTITASVGGNTGTFQITSHTKDYLVLWPTPGDGDPVEYYVHDGGSLILTRNAQSFAAYIHAAGYAYTFKAGKLYTNMPTDQLKNACSILFDPLT